MRIEFEKWFKTTSVYQMLESMNYYKMDLFHWVESRSEYRHTSVQIAFMTWVEQQTKIDAIKQKLHDIYDASDENEEVAHLLDEIQELIK